MDKSYFHTDVRTNNLFWLIFPRPSCLRPLSLLVPLCHAMSKDTTKPKSKCRSYRLSISFFPSCFSFLFLFAADLQFRTCERTWRKVGCFKDLKGGQRALKEQMVNIRDRKSKVFPTGEPKLSWKYLTESFHRYALKRPVGLIQFVSSRSGLMMLYLVILSSFDSLIKTGNSS